MPTAALNHSQFALVVAEGVTWKVADRFSVDDRDVDYCKTDFGVAVTMEMFDRKRSYVLALQTVEMDLSRELWKFTMEISNTDKPGNVVAKFASCDTRGVIEHDDFVSVIGTEAFEIETAMMTVLGYAVRSFVEQLGSAYSRPQ